MDSEQKQKHHIESFSRLTLAQRLFWAFSQHQFLVRFMDAEAKRSHKNIRRNGKRYFKRLHLA